LSRPQEQRFPDPARWCNCQSKSARYKCARTSHDVAVVICPRLGVQWGPRCHSFFGDSDLPPPTLKMVIRKLPDGEPHLAPLQMSGHNLGATRCISRFDPVMTSTLDGTIAGKTSISSPSPIKAAILCLKCYSS